ncbi:hypothetical protein D3C84_1150760 [compost metagenome]
MPETNQCGDHLRIGRQLDEFLIDLVGDLRVVHAHVVATPHDRPRVGLTDVSHATSEY